MKVYDIFHTGINWLCCVLISDGASQAVVSPLLCPPGLECLLDAGQLVTHMGNLRHDYSLVLCHILSWLSSCHNFPIN